jgi:hypothetical protein
VTLANSLLAAWRSYRRRKGLAREATTFVLGLFAGLVIMPLGIYFVGQVLLGGYLRSATDSKPAGLAAFFGDYFAGIAAGEMAHWLVLLGPYVMYLIFRIGRSAFRA